MSTNVFSLVSKLAEPDEDKGIEEIIQYLVDNKNTLESVVLVAEDSESDLVIRSSKMTRAEAYYLMGLAQNYTLLGE